MDDVDAADSPAIIQCLERHEVSVAYSAMEALKHSEDTGQNVVFLDIGMPDMHGLETAAPLAIWTAALRQ